jgi:hypothetical protein
MGDHAQCRLAHPRCTISSFMIVTPSSPVAPTPNSGWDGQLAHEDRVEGRAQPGATGPVERPRRPVPGTGSVRRGEPGPSL